MDRLRTKLGSDYVGTKFFQFQFQTTDTNGGCQLFRFRRCTLSCDHRVAVRDHRLYTGYADKFVIVINRDRLTILKSLLGSLSKGLFPCLIECQRYHILGITHGVLLRSRLCTVHFRTGQDDGTVFQHLFDRLIEHILWNHITCRVHTVGADVVLIAFTVRLGNKIQASRFTKFLQDRIGVRHTRDLNIDPVGALLIYLRLRAVILYTLLQLVNRVVHILGIRILISHHLICDADTTCQIQSQLNT